MRGFKAGTTDPGYEAYMRIGLIGKKLVLSSKVTILTFLLALIAYLLGLLCRDSKGFLSVYLANISPLVPGDNLTTLTMLLASLLVIFIATATLLFKGRGELPLVGGLILLLAGTINYLLPFKDLIPVVLWTATITLALWRPKRKRLICAAGSAFLVTLVLAVAGHANRSGRPFHAVIGVCLGLFIILAVLVVISGLLSWSSYGQKAIKVLLGILLFIVGYLISLFFGPQSFSQTQWAGSNFLPFGFMIAGALLTSLFLINSWISGQQGLGGTLTCLEVCLLGTGATLLQSGILGQRPFYHTSLPADPESFFLLVALSGLLTMVGAIFLAFSFRPGPRSTTGWLPSIKRNPPLVLLLMIPVLLLAVFHIREQVDISINRAHWESESPYISWIFNGRTIWRGGLRWTANLASFILLIAGGLLTNPWAGQLAPRSGL